MILRAQSVQAYPQFSCFAVKSAPICLEMPQFHIQVWKLQYKWSLELYIYLYYRY